MNAKTTLARRHVGATIVAAALSAFVAIGLLTAVAEVFQHDGVPLEQVAIAERACADHAFVSQREACMRTFLAALRGRSVASR